MINELVYVDTITISTCLIVICIKLTEKWEYTILRVQYKVGDLIILLPIYTNTFLS